jgi:hypothetical protein
MGSASKSCGQIVGQFVGSSWTLCEQSWNLVDGAYFLCRLLWRLPHLEYSPQCRMQIETYPDSKNPVRVRVHYKDKDSDQIL